MIGVNWVKGGISASAVVGVIASPAALVQATRLRRPPDLFELRLDTLRHSLDQVNRAIPNLRAPLILTARHPAEGGQGSLRPDARRALLERFLKHAAFIDVELRFLSQMRPFLRKARREGVALILSWHDVKGTVSRSALLRKGKSAASEGAAIFKIVTRTDTQVELARFISLFQETPRTVPIAAMGIGKLGRISRLELAQLGSVLTYASLGKPIIAGLPALSQLRQHRKAYGI